MSNLRDRLVSATLSWQERFGITPRITDAVAEFDAAMIIGMSHDEYSIAMRGRTAVSRGHDFAFRGIRYQVKANRPSGSKGSKVTLVSKAKNYDWDVLIWLLYNREYVLIEAWAWDVSEYRTAFGDVSRINPAHMRNGRTAIQPPEPSGN